MQKNSVNLNSAMRDYAKLVYSLAYSRTQNHADAEDIFQEVFLRLAQRSEPFHDEEHCKAWLIRVTANLSVNLIASAWRRHVTLREYLPQHRNIPAAEETFDLDDVMKKLSDQQRMVLVLRYSENMSVEEIAYTLQESVPTIRKRIVRAKQKLGRLLSEQKEEESSNVYVQR